jgi:hypothetical protein
MEGEIVDRAKDFALDLDEQVETIWKVFDNGFTVEIVWEALNLIELYFTLRIIEYILITTEYMFIEARTTPLDLIEQEFVQGKKVTGGFFEDGKSRLWQMFKIDRISGTGINVRGKLTMNSTKGAGLYGNFLMGPDRTSNHPLVPYATEALTSSYCC